jgi:DNA-binding XRE family transcriptional regulator
MDSVAYRVRSIRRSAGITQKECARLAGCSQQTIVDVEAGRVNHSRFVGDIARALNVGLHWLETGQGARDRPGRTQGKVAVVGWDYFLPAAQDSTTAPAATDRLDSCPVANSGDMAMVIVDERTSFTMLGKVVLGEWLFVDMQRRDDGLVVVVMPGWQRAELRELTTIGGRRFLVVANTNLPDSMLPVVVYSKHELYAHAVQTGGELAPALIMGRVIFSGNVRS